MKNLALIICLFAIQIGHTQDSAWPGSNLGTLSCPGTTSASGNTTGANIDCLTSGSGDHIYQFTISTTTTVNLSLCNGTNFDTEIRLFDLSNGDCDGGAIASNDQFCSDQSEINMSCLAAGTYVVVVEGYSSSEGNYSLEITTSQCGCPPPSNDDPCNAIALSAGQTCNYATYSTSAATASAGVPAPGCADYQGGDVWFSTVVPATGSITVNTLDMDITDSDIALYSGSCGSLSLIECDDADSENGLMGRIDRTGLTPGATIYIRVWEYGNDVSGNFGICVVENGPCGNPENNDYCSSPATLTYSVGDSWSSTTSGIYTADETQLDFAEFCGSIENNSWYKFTATQTSHDFDFTAVSNCVDGFGIQAAVFDITTDANGCCTAFTDVSNCFNPGSATTGTVTATGLTIGNDYVLMVDGESGDDCDYTVSDWNASGILPIEFLNLTATSTKQGDVKLNWKTLDEEDEDYFVVERSINGNSFEEIGIVEAQSLKSNYQYTDFNVKSSCYYRIKHLDKFKQKKYSNVIKVKNNNIDVIEVYPNPFEGNITITTSTNENLVIQISNTMGEIVKEIKGLQSNHSEKLDLSELKPGIYFVSTNTSNIFKKIIKK